MSAGAVKIIWMSLFGFAKAADSMEHACLADKIILPTYFEVHLVSRKNIDLLGSIFREFKSGRVGVFPFFK